jgi:DHA1 family multidrug resistance protein-like MFS transporter
VKKYEQLIAICISTVLVMAGQGIVSPILPLYADSFGVSTALVGATVTAFGLARLFTNGPAGIVADRSGRRKLLIGGPLVTAVGMFGSGLANTIWVLLGFRFVAGLGSALYMTGATIYLLDIASAEQRGRFIAANQGALLVGVGFGPALGGLIADRYDLSMPFYVVAVAGVLTAVYSFFRLPETWTAAEARAAKDTTIGQTSRWALLRSHDFLLVGLVTIGVFSVRAGVRQTLVPLQLSESFGLKVDELGVLFTALGLIGVVLIWPAGAATDRFGRKTIIVPTATVLSGLLADAVSISFAIGVNAVFMGIAAAAFMAFAGSSSPAVEN